MWHHSCCRRCWFLDRSVCGLCICYQRHCRHCRWHRHFNFTLPPRKQLQKEYFLQTTAETRLLVLCSGQTSAGIFHFYTRCWDVVPRHGCLVLERPSVLRRDHSCNSMPKYFIMPIRWKKKILSKQENAHWWRCMAARWATVWRPFDIDDFTKRQLKAQPQSKWSPCLRRLRNFIPFAFIIRFNFGLEIKSFNRVTGDGKIQMGQTTCTGNSPPSYQMLLQGGL